MLELREVRKTFYSGTPNEKKALNGIELHLDAGEFVTVIGSNGAGKSTLFNRLTKTRQAIVNEEAGTTRDRQYGKSEWLGREFSVVDTGGWVVNSDDIFEEEIRKQVLMAVDEADVILFVVDVMNGVTDLDLQVASILRRTKSRFYWLRTRPIIMSCNIMLPNFIVWVWAIHTVFRQ